MDENTRARWILRAHERLISAGGCREVKLSPDVRYLTALIPAPQEFSHRDFPGQRIEIPVCLLLPDSFPIVPPVTFGLATQNLLKNGREIPGSYFKINGWSFYRLGFVGWSPHVEIDRGHHFVHLIARLQEVLRSL